jgi:uncharacterized Zn finger protein
MVSYDATFTALPNPPPSCPECGSHRTQIVGIAEGGQKIVVRCNACGAHSNVTITREGRPASEPAMVARRVQDWQHT